MKVTVPLSQAINKSEEQQLSVIFFSGNPFFGSNYTMSDTIQEIYSNHTALVSWRDQNGNYMGNEFLKGKIKYEMQYLFQKFKLPASQELGITHCAYMSHGTNDFGN